MQLLCLTAALIVLFLIFAGLTLFIVPSTPCGEDSCGVFVFICCGLLVFAAIALTVVLPLIVSATDSLELIDEGTLENMELKLLDVIESCQESIVVLTPDWFVITANEATLNSFRVLKVANASFMSIVHPNDQAKLTNGIHELHCAQVASAASDRILNEDVSSAFDVSFSYNSMDMRNHKNPHAGRPHKSVKHLCIEYRVSDRKQGWIWIESTFVVRCDDHKTPPSAMRRRPFWTGRLLPLLGCSPSAFCCSTSRAMIHTSQDNSDAYTITMLSRNVNAKKREELFRVEEQKQKAKELENQAKLNYITCCAHDLKTPLQSFKFAIELLEHSSLRPDQADIVEQARVSASIMSMTISQTMDTSKVLMGQTLIPRKATVQLSDIISHVAMVIDTYGRQVPITFHLAEGIYNKIITSEEWLWQMLLNYLTNACKFTESGSIDAYVQLWSQSPQLEKLSRISDKTSLLSCDMDITEAASSADVLTAVHEYSGADDSSYPTASDKHSPTEYLLFQIMDTGVGVSSDHIPALFNLYSQAQVGQATGTGIGLYGVKIRAEGLEGDCGMCDRQLVTDNAEHGSVFWFKIPFLPDRSTYAKNAANDFLADASHYQHYSYAVQHDRKAKELKLYLPQHAPHSRVRKATRMPSLSLEVPDRTISTSVSNAPCVSPSAAPQPQSDINSELAGTNLTAFVVDDVKSIRKLMHRSLVQLGFKRIELFENGSSALRAMKEEHVDVVFMDIQMPVMSGPEVTV